MLEVLPFLPLQKWACVFSFLSSFSHPLSSLLACLPWHQGYLHLICCHWLHLILSDSASYLHQDTHTLSLYKLCSFCFLPLPSPLPTVAVSLPTLFLFHHSVPCLTASSALCCFLPWCHSLCWHQGSSSNSSQGRRFRSTGGTYTNIWLAWWLFIGGNQDFNLYNFGMEIKIHFWNILRCHRTQKVGVNYITRLNLLW